MSGVRALLFDVGNTRLKWSVYEDGRFKRTGSVAHEKLKREGYSVLTTRLPKRVDRILASNVAGATFATRLSGVIGLHCDADVHFAHTRRQAYGVTNSYRQPRRMGVDRWVAMIGAYADFHSALCIVDAGTAVTIDVVDRQGKHLGGQIIPGIGLLDDALRRETSDIPVTGRRPKAPGAGLDMFASDTGGAILNGSFNAICGAIERAVKRLRSASYRPKVVLTGGDASRILQHLDGDPIHRPHLVLQGLAFMLERDS